MTARSNSRVVLLMSIVAVVSANSLRGLKAPGATLPPHKCGKTWRTCADGSACVSDADCTVAGERCFANPPSENIFDETSAACLKFAAIPSRSSTYCMLTSVDDCKPAEQRAFAGLTCEEALDQRFGASVVGRCGMSWQTSENGTACTAGSDADCTIAAERCFVDPPVNHLDPETRRRLSTVCDSIYALPDGERNAGVPMAAAESKCSTDCAQPGITCADFAGSDICGCRGFPSSEPAKSTPAPAPVSSNPAPAPPTATKHDDKEDEKKVKKEAGAMEESVDKSKVVDAQSESVLDSKRTKNLVTILTVVGAILSISLSIYTWRHKLAKRAKVKAGSNTLQMPTEAGSRSSSEDDRADALADARLDVIAQGAIAVAAA